MAKITIPKPPSVFETPTGITTEDPGTTRQPSEGFTGELQRGTPGAPSLQAGGGMTEAQLAQGLVDATKEQSQAEFEADKKLQEEAIGLQEGIAGQVSATGERIEGVQGDLEEDKKILDARIGAALEAVEQIPQQVTTEFERLREEFGTVSSAALADIDTKAATAMDQVMDGRATAMQAAVQGIQGNINSTVAQIQANPNLTAGQKTSMIAQTRLAGASAIAPAIGANILEFNTLAANVATAFGGFTANLQTQIISEEGAFGRAGAQAFADATIASQNITGQLLGTQATSDAAFANSQATLEGVRTQMEMSGNQLLLNNLPNLGEPVLNLIDTASTATILGTDIITRDFERESIGTQMEITMELLKMQVGTPVSRVVDAFISGDIIGGIAQIGEEIFSPPPSFG